MSKKEIEEDAAIKNLSAAEKDFLNLTKRYDNKIKTKIEGPQNNRPPPIFSREYQQFKNEYMPPTMSLYEKGCNISEKILKISPDHVKAAKLQSAIDICHLSVSPSGTTSFSVLFPMIIIFFGSLLSYLLLNSKFFVFLFVMVGVISILPLGNLPYYMATAWRMKASNQMVISVFYVVTFMRHTSNLEKALEFASDHLSPPLSLDLRKVLWDVETEKYDSVKESLDMYLETWREYNREFIEAFHLIESSLYESFEERRLEALDKSLDVMLTETYEKMLHYAHDLKNPITMLHMMGIILPILGLVILPLVVSFMETVKWYHISAIYNFLLPVGVYYLGKVILSSRPTGYGDTDISEEHPELKKYRYVLINLFGKELKVPPSTLATLFGLILLFIGITPILLHVVAPGFDIEIGDHFKLLDYKPSMITGKTIGPFGLGATILSFFIPLSLGLGLGLYYRLKSKNVMKLRDQSKKLEKEFASALFQLGNRLGDNIPAELAFGRVADIMKDTVSGNFFKLVANNIQRLGLGVKEAIFNPQIGALLYYPSNIISSSMKVLVQSIRKGPEIAAQALMNISRYIKEIHKVDERLKDLMSEIISSMKSQISFLTPVISGIVIGITSMITNIITQLSATMSSMEGGEAGSIGGMTDFFGEGLPTFYFQFVVGIYVVQIVYILTILGNGIENGQDKLSERYQLGINLIKSIVLYCVVALSVTLIFNFIANSIMLNTMDLS